MIQQRMRRLTNYPVLAIFVVLSTIILLFCRASANLSRYYTIGAGFLPSSGRTRRLPRNEASPGEGGQPLLCPTSKRLLVTPHSFALEIEMLYERRSAVIFRSPVASIKLRFSSRE